MIYIFYQLRKSVPVLQSRIVSLYYFGLFLIARIILIANPTEIPTNAVSLYWIPDATLIQRRTWHEAVLLANGKIIVSGGVSDYGIIAQRCELYSSSTGWQAGSFMQNPRYQHTLTLFANNAKALATGSGLLTYQRTAEVYDSSSDTWTLTSTNMSTGRYAHTATLLKNGEILIVGGIQSSGLVLSSTELFTSSSSSFTRINNLNVGRFYFASTLLNDGSTVLVTGGGDPNYKMTPTAELYISGSWVFTANYMTQPRAYHASVLLNDGNVLIAGGGNGATVSYSTAEIYNPTTGTFTSVGSMTYRRGAFTLTLLPSGQVLATGGIDWTTNTYPATCELYDPVNQSWSTTRILNNGRSCHRTVLLNGSTLTIGGIIDNNGLTGTCEKYTV
jgi:hypothetical protein